MLSHSPEAVTIGGEWMGRVFVGHEEYKRAIVDLYEKFPGGGAEGVLPPHFVEATFPKIGGRIIQFDNGVSSSWGLMMPSYGSLDDDWTMRILWDTVSLQEQQVRSDEIRRYFLSHGLGNVTVYNVAEKTQEPFSGQVFERDSDDISFMRPDTNQAKEARELQRFIWNVTNPAFLYPFDLYRPDSGLATRLVAVEADVVVGFLFGFYGKGKQWFGTQNGFKEGHWIESQLMGIKPTHRRTGIARRLKFLQREMSISEDIDVVHWTVDPLQAGNAFLNFNTLGGVAAQHYQDYYPFRNDLNMVQASRIGVSWVLHSPRVSACAEGETLVFNYDRLTRDSSVEIIEPMKPFFDPKGWAPKGDQVLLEIPLDWNRVQKDDIETAGIWRDKTDAVLAKILDQSTFGYVVSGVVKSRDQERVFLVIGKATSKLGVA